ncbi:hypothetical protein WJX77_009682 [Trebouxia sp. C0004]
MSQRGMKLINSCVPPEFAAELHSEPIISGTLYRESGVVSGITNQRWAALFPHCVATFRKQGTKEPSKVWPLSPRCQLSKIKSKEFMVREKHTSTIWALAAGHYDRKCMFYFTVHGPSTHLFGKDGLKVCFERDEDAQQWREAFRETISHLSTDLVGRHISTDMATRSPSTSTFQESPLGRERANSSASLTPASSPGSEVFMDHSNLAKSLLDSRAQMAARSQGAPTSQSEHTADLLRMTRESMNGSFTSKLSPGRPTIDEQPSMFAQRMSTHRGEKRRWANLRHVNGVAVYQEHAEQSGEGGAFMVSAVVRATPKSCFQALMDRSDWKDTPLLSQLEVLEVLDSQSQVLKGTVLPHGAANTMCAPRELVLQQMWREEEDGTFIVLLHSTKHRRAAMPPASWSWWQPIRAQMASAGFTIAPLSTKYQAAGGSQECLVTMVLKLDLGGWLSEQGRMGWLLRPFMHGIHSSYLEPMLMSVIALRDKVEQDRFTVKPFSMGQQSDPDKYERTTTMVMRSKSMDSRNWNASAFHSSKLAAVRTNLVADASSSAEPRVQHVNADGETVATAGEEGDSGGPATQDAPANLGTCDPKYWSCPGAAGYKVRGQTYLKDKKKIEADEPVFGLASVDLVEVEAPTWHIAQHLPAIRDSKAPFTFVVQLMVPGPPFLSLTMAWAADYDPSKPMSSDTPQSQTDGSPVFSGNDADSDSELVKSPFDLCLARFLAGDDKEAEQRRSCMFKLIPSVVKGSWVIKQAVGNTPVLLGKKLTTHYYRGPGHFEVDVDVGSSRAAASVVGLVSPVTTSLIIDMAIVLEGREEQELPEQLLGVVRFDKVDMKSAAYLDINTGKVHPKGT